MKKHVHSKCVHPPFRAHPWLCGFFVALTVLLPGCEHQTGRAGSFSTTSESGPPRIWYWETRTDVSVVGSQLCEPLEQDTNKGVYTCRVPVLRGSSDEPVILAVSEGEALEVKRWDFPDEWDPPGWPFQLEHPGNTVGEIHLSRTDDMHQHVVPLNEIQWRLAWDADDPPPLEAWVVFRVATSAGGDPLEVAMYYDGTLEQPWREAGGEGESTESHCAGQRSGGGTTEVPCYLPAPPPGEEYQVDVWLRGADRPVEETISLSKDEPVAESPTRLRCPGEGEDSYTLYYPDKDRDGYGDSNGEPVVACGAMDGFAATTGDCEGDACGTPPPTYAPDDLDHDGFSPTQGDCNDDDPLAHPGAVDPDMDGVDQDCGGLDGPQPHVGLNERSAASIQAALDASPDDPAVTVWVGPGTYYEFGVTFRGKALRLKSTEGEKQTVVDAQKRESVFTFIDGEGNGTLLDGITVRGGNSEYGGGISIWQSNPMLNNVIITGNQAVKTSYGGGLFLSYSNPILTNLSVIGNSASYGGGIYLIDSNPALTNIVLVGNEALSTGGGIYLSLSNPEVNNVTIVENRAGWGGGMFLFSSSPTLTQVTISGNSATFIGGGIFLTDFTSKPVLNNVILANNFPFNLYNDPIDPAVPILTYCDIYSPTGMSNHNLSSLDSTSLSVDPAFVFFSPNQDPSDDDLRLQPGSPLRDAGDPALLDLDGSISEIGAYGGLGADATYYLDSDQDNLYDGWEQRYLGDLAQSGAEDADGDGLSNRGELTHGTLASVSDTDDDGWMDGDEVDADSIPLEASSQPGVSDIVVARVPQDFGTIQAAINWCWYTCAIEVAQGEYEESIRIEGKTISLHGAGTKTTIIQAPPDERVITSIASHLLLDGFTIAGGSANTGGGLYLSWVTGTLQHLLISGNSAVTHGGGIHLNFSSPTLTQVTLTGNSAEVGGGMHLDASSPMLIQVTLTDNSADIGGGIFLNSSSPTLTQVTLLGNSAFNSGGAMYLQYSFPTVTQVAITGNTASMDYGNGGGIYLYSSTATLLNCIVAYNNANSGGNLYNFITGTVTANRSAFYNPPNLATDNLTPSGTFLTVEPKFLVYANTFTGLPCLSGSSTSCLPSDLHLSKSSPLINAGDPSILDPDGSRSDIGSYGGPDGDAWDLDGDGLPDYFWPGTWADAPEGFESTDYDCDDLDSTVGGCP